MAASTDKFSRLAALRLVPSPSMKAAQLRAPDEEDVLGRILGAGVGKNRFGEHLAIRNWFSTPEFFQPSSTTLDLLCHARGDPVQSKTRSAIENPEKWLFLDTETTGLTGGAGTCAFLAGVAWWDAGGLQVEQFFMREFTEEYSILCELAARLGERPVLVTFNGKTFDWPLLENRFTLTRSIRAPKLAAHLDLLHPARALWKLRLGSVRLTELESRVLDAPRLGWHRLDDVSSAMIPQYYFDYLRGGPVEPLAGVVRHNQMDLRGLAALFCKINEMLSESSEAGKEIESLDLFGLSRFLHRRGDTQRAQSACAEAVAMGLPDEFRPEAVRNLALMARRSGEHARAAALWEELLCSPDHCFRACEQLAIYSEHRLHDVPGAIEYTRLALERIRALRLRCENMLDTGRLARLEQRFRHRLTRLQLRERPSHSASRLL